MVNGRMINKDKVSIYLYSVNNNTMEGFDPKQESQGLGDTIATASATLSILKKLVTLAKLAGAPGCGCNERRELLNELFPYESKIRKFIVKEKFVWGPETFRPGQLVEVNKNHTLYGGVIGLVKEGKIEELTK